MSCDPHTSEFYVVDEDGDSIHVHAPDAQAAAQRAVDEWGLEADPGYRFRVFAAEDAKHFEFKLTVAPYSGSDS